MGYYDIYGNTIGQTKLDDPKIKSLLSKISNKTARNGVIALFNEEYSFKSLDRALDVISMAKTEHDLQVVEAALQTTINEIREFNVHGSKCWNDGKASLYLFTLQYLILNLNKYELENSKNNYVSQLAFKYQNTCKKCIDLSVDLDIMNQQCLTTEYQQPENEDLKNFKFIDLKRVDAFNMRLNRYAVTRNKEDLFDTKDYLKGLPTKEQIDIILNKLILHFEKKYKLEKFTLKAYDEHLIEILNEINTIFATANKGVSRYINDALYNRLKVQEKDSTAGRLI